MVDVLLDSFLKGVANQLGQSLVLLIVGGAPAVGWFREFFGRREDQERLDARLNQDAVDRRIASSNSKPLSEAAFLEKLKLFDCELHDSLQSTLPEFKRRDLTQHFWNGLQELRVSVPSGEKIKFAFGQYDQAVSGLLTHVEFVQIKSSKLYALFNGVKSAFKLLTLALNAPMSEDEEKKYDQRTISPSRLANVFAWLTGATVETTSTRWDSIYRGIKIRELDLS